MQTTDVLIAGAGPTGLALACYLRSRGVDVRVVDRFERPAVTTRALGIQPRGRLILDRLGALGDLAHEAIPHSSFDLFVDGRHRAHVELAALAGPDDDGVLRVPQTAIERRLRERLRELGTEVRFSHELRAATQDATGVEVTVRTRDGEERWRASWLVGCDGAHSVVRGVIGASFQGGAFPGTFLIADVRMSWDTRAGAFIYLRGDDVLTMASLPDGRWRVGVALPPGDPLAERGRTAMTAERDRSAATEAEALARLEALFQQYSGDTRTRLTEPTWFSVFRINRRMASRFRLGRVLIAGDAAHLTSPLGGQGMNTGLADAFNLAWKLDLVVRGRADAALLDTYEAERRPAVEAVERATTQWTNALLGRGALGRVLRGWVLLPLLQWPAFQRWALTRRRALRGGYRRGPLASTVGPWLMARGVRAGDLAPDARCTRALDGAPTTIGRELGTCWGLLLWPGDASDERVVTAARRLLSGEPLRVRRFAAREQTHADSDDDAHLADERGAVARAYGARRGTVVLVRPDGHVAWRGTASAVGGLEAWLESVFGRPAAR